MRITNDPRGRSAAPGASAGDARPFSARRLPGPRWRVPVALSLLAAGAVLAAPAVASASSLPSPVTGHVYLDDNTAGSNTIAAFDRHADGSLTPLPGSPFAAGGGGTGAGLAAEVAVQIADGGRFLLAVDAGSNQVSVLRIQPDGSLRLASVVSSGGVLPVSVAVHGSLVYVANAGPADSDYTGFRLAPWGGLTPVPGSTVALRAAAQPGDVLFNGTGLGTVSAFTDSGAGVLTSIGSSPVADQQTAPCWVTISPDGRYLFAVNTGSGTISRYSIAPGGALTLLGSTQVSANGGVGGVDPGLSPDGRFLYVNESKISSVGAFAVSGGGNLTELPGSPTPLPAGATPAGIAVS